MASYDRGPLAPASNTGRLLSTAFPNENVGFVETGTHASRPCEGPKISCLPSRDHIGWMPNPISYVVPSGGNGCVKRRTFPPSDAPTVYATHRTSGDTVAAVGPVEVIDANGTICLSANEYCSTVCVACSTLSNNRYLPSGDADWGTCNVPGGAFVSCSAAPAPSARVQKMPPRPS